MEVKTDKKILLEFIIGEQLKKRLFEIIPKNIFSKVSKAVRFAENRHTGQVRPGNDPQINHVLRVAIIAAKYALVNCTELLLFLVQASLLHDVLEDTLTTDEEIRREFGDTVAKAVRTVSHVDEDEPEEVYFRRIVNGGRLAVLTKRFDRLDNIRRLINAPADFKKIKLKEHKKSLWIWQDIDPEGHKQIKKAIEEVEIWE